MNRVRTARVGCGKVGHIHAAALKGLAEGQVEKPMAANLADCDAMLAAVRKAGVFLGAISQRRLYEPVRRIKEAIDAGKIVRPACGLFLMYSWREPAYYQSGPWRGKWASEGGGVFVNQSPHQFDLLQWLLGPVSILEKCFPSDVRNGLAIRDLAVTGGGLLVLTSDALYGVPWLRSPAQADTRPSAAGGPARRRAPPRREPGPPPTPR